MNIYCLGTLFTQLTLGLNVFITAQGKILISMCNVAVGAVTNIVLDAVFMNGFGFSNIDAVNRKYGSDQF
jgi:Na+-driven multidrug efflux pump